MDDTTIHIAITRRVRKKHTQEFERMLAEFAGRSLTVGGSRGVHLLYPPPGSDPLEYGILRSFASAADRDAFYASDFYRDWIAQIAYMIEGEPVFRQLDGLEAWFHEPHSAMPPRWKMATATVLGVFPTSVLLGVTLGPLTRGWPFPLGTAAFAIMMVALLTWVVMPLVTRILHAWLHPK